MASNLVIQLSDQTLSQFKDTLVWNPETKIEQVYKIKSSSGSQTIDFSDIANVKVMIFKSSTAFSLSMTISGSTVTYLTDYFIFTPASSMLANISNIAISTSSTTDILVDVRIYGKTS